MEMMVFILQFSVMRKEKHFTHEFILYGRHN